MITNEQMDEWLKEVEERPMSSIVIVRLALGRLRTLTQRNEELLAENIALRTEKRADEYEQRIANLEYQLNLIRRQIGNVDNSIGTNSEASSASSHILLYSPKGYLLRFDCQLSDLQKMRFHDGEKGEVIPVPSVGSDTMPLRLLFVNPHEELLFLFTSGRVTTLQADHIPSSNSSTPDWDRAYLAEPHAGETLAAVTVVGRMALADHILQISRKGYAKRIMRASFEQHLAKGYIGSGVKATPDQSFEVLLANKGDKFTVVTSEGFTATFPVSQLAYTAEEMLKLSTTDYLIAAFTVDESQTILFFTNIGKVVNRESAWLETPNTNKSRGQAVLSPARRDTGIRIVGAAAVKQGDILLAYHGDGKITIHEAQVVIAEGVIPTTSNLVSISALKVSRSAL